MRVELKRVGDVTVRNVVNVALKPDYLLGTDFEPGNDVYIAYSKKMIIMCRDLDVINKLAEKDFCIIVDKSKRRKGLPVSN